MTELAIGLTGIVIGVVLQGLNGWLTDKRAARMEHAKWLREKRYDVYMRVYGGLNDALIPLKNPQGSFHIAHLGPVFVALNEARMLTNDGGDRKAMLRILALMQDASKIEEPTDRIDPIREAVATCEEVLGARLREAP